MRLSARRCAKKQRQAFMDGLTLGHERAKAAMDEVCLFMERRRSSVPSYALNAFVWEQAYMEGLRYLTYHYDEDSANEEAKGITERFYNDRKLNFLNTDCLSEQKAA